MSPTIADFVGGSPLGRPDEPPFKEGKAAEHPLGVLYQGPWSEEADGFNEHVRRCARALALTGCPVHLRGFKFHFYHGAPRDMAPDIAPLLTASIGRYSLTIHQLVALKPEDLFKLTKHRRLRPEENDLINSFKIISTVWERDRLEQGYVDALNRVAQAWVACRANAEMLQLSGVDADRIRVIPVPYFDDDPLLALRCRKRTGGPVRFYHIGKWEPRKAQDNIIRAFLKAFRPGEAQLIIRTSALRTPVQDYPRSPDEALARCLDDRAACDKAKDIKIIRRRLTNDEMVDLHRYGDVYVTLSRGEGFDMPAFDAKLAGNLMVYTPSGGPQDFASSSDVFVSSSGSVPCHPMYNWEPDACYLDYAIEDAAHAMRVARERILSGMSLAEPDLSSFRAQEVGTRMLENLEEIVTRTNGKVFER